MTIYYKDNAFYNDDLGAVPAGAVEISERQHAELLAALNAGCLILPDLSVTPPPPSSLHTWDGKTWVLDKAAAQQHKAVQQEEMWTRIKAKREEQRYGGAYIPALKKWLQTDEPSRTQYLQLQLLEAKGLFKQPVRWKTMDNSFIGLDAAAVTAIALQIMDNEQADFANAERHKAAMEKVEHPLEYDYSDGWTANYEQPAAELEETEK